MAALRKGRFSIRSVKTGEEMTYDGYTSKHFGVRMCEHGFWQVTHLPSQSTINAWDSRY